MDPAVADEPEKMQPPAWFCRLGERFLDDGVGRQLAVGDGFGDAGQVLVNDAPRAQVEVPDLGVAHLAVRQAHVEPAGAQAARGVFLHHLVSEGRTPQDRRVAVAFGVLGRVRVDAPAVADDENNRRRHRKKSYRSLRPPNGCRAPGGCPGPGDFPALCG